MATKISLRQLETAALQGSIPVTDANGELVYLDPVTPGYILRAYDAGGGQIGVQWANPDFAIGNVYVVPNWATAMTLTATWGDDQTGDIVKVTADEQFTPPTLKVYIWDGNTLVDITTDPVALSDLTDVDMSTPPTAGQALVYNGTKWAPGSVSVTNKFTQGGDSFGVAARLGTNDNFNLQFETNNTLRGAIDTFGQFAWNEVPGTFNGTFIIKNVAAYGSNTLYLVTSAGNTSHLFTETMYNFFNAGTISAFNGYGALQSGATFHLNAPAAGGFNICLPNGSGQVGLASNRGLLAIYHQGGTYGASLPRDMVIFCDSAQSGAVVGAISQKGTITFKGQRVGVVPKTSAYTVTINDCILEGDATGGTFDFTLPSAADAYDSGILSGNIFHFYKIDSAFPINIKTSGGTIIATLNAGGESFSCYSNGTNYRELNVN